jgi:metacaspase-1
MCFKKKQPVVIEPAKKRALLFGINKYGGGHDLQGCINDIEDVKSKLNKEFPGFDISMYKDSQVTGKLFFDTIKAALLVMRAGDILYIHYSGHGCQIPSSVEANGYHEALYLFDGAFIDDQVQTLQAITPDGAIVIAKFDSCFSGDMLREINPVYRKSKFYPLAGARIRSKVMNRFAKQKDLVMKWVVFSGCSEEETSLDCEFNGRPNGAFTYFDNKSYGVNSSYSSEINKLHSYIPTKEYDQNPTLDGDNLKFGRSVFQ